MADMPNSAEPGKPRRRWFQFGLRTMLGVMAALGVLLTQWPLVERQPRTQSLVDTAGKHGASVEIISGGNHFVPARVVAVASVNAASLIGWLVWRRIRSRAPTPILTDYPPPQSFDLVCRPLGRIEPCVPSLPIPILAANPAIMPAWTRSPTPLSRRSHDDAGISSASGRCGSESQSQRCLARLQRKSAIGKTGKEATRSATPNPCGVGGRARPLASASSGKTSRTGSQRSRRPSCRVMLQR